MSEQRQAQSLAVLYVINQLGPGGTERSLAHLLPFLRAEGIEPSIVCLRATQRELADEAEVCCPITILGGGGRLRNIRRLRRFLAGSRFDLVHTMLFEADLVGRFAALGSGLPVLASLVSISYDPAQLRNPHLKHWRLSVAREIDLWTGRLLVTHFHALTQAVMHAAVRHLGIPPRRISVVGRGRDPARLGTPSPERRARSRQVLGLDSGDEVVVTVGRQDYLKGHRFLLEAAALLAPQRPRLRFLIAGKEGQMTVELQRLWERLGVGEIVRFLGNRADVPEVLAAADLFAFPSLSEGIGGAAIEAMALGLPIVSSDLPSLREVLAEGENALLVAPEDPPALASAIGRLLEDRELAARFARRSRAIFEERFRIEQSAAGMADLYREVVANFASSRRGRRP